ncbi:unnamed protein product [Polarella glacialis]|uniref:Uncharacterized protein n=1 Tax=Polarella glacialis TaxID=89957 RepID=A0A813EH65_POLGL|nr:unnamed protein product [Polarella glacialis]
MSGIAVAPAHGGTISQSKDGSPCNFAPWGAGWRSLQFGCAGKGKDGIRWNELKTRIHNCLSLIGKSRRRIHLGKRPSAITCAPGSEQTPSCASASTPLWDHGATCDISFFVAPLLSKGDSEEGALGGPEFWSRGHAGPSFSERRVRVLGPSERRALQLLCALLGQPRLCPQLPRGSRGAPSQWTENGADGGGSLKEECFVGLISVILAAMAAAAGHFGEQLAGSESNDAQQSYQSTVSKQTVRAAATRFLAEMVGARAKQLPVLQLLLSGWPLFELLALLGVRRPGSPSGAVRELHRRAAVFSSQVVRLQGCSQELSTFARPILNLSATCVAEWHELVAGPQARACLCRLLRPIARADTLIWRLEHSLAALVGGALWTTLRSSQQSMLQLVGFSTKGKLQPPAQAYVKGKQDLRLQSWPLDFVIPAISVDDMLGGCMPAEGLNVNRHVSAAARWAASFHPQSLPPKRWSPRQHQKVAFATLLSDDVQDPARFQQWLTALEVMSWSLRRFPHSAEEKSLSAVPPLLVLCEERLHCARPQFLQFLRSRGFIPMPVSMLPAPPVPEGGLRSDLSQGWLRIHLWRLTEYERIVYLDTADMSATPFPEQTCWLNIGIMAIVPNASIFNAMGVVLEKGLLHQHPEFRVGSYLDQAWIDLFFRYYSSLPRGGFIRWRGVLSMNASVSPQFKSDIQEDICPPPWGAEEPEQVREVPLASLPGAHSVAVKVCMLDPAFNFFVSFPGLNTRGDALANACSVGACGTAAASIAMRHSAGLRILHWPGGKWKPWDTHCAGPWCRSVADELWWAAYAAAKAEGALAFAPEFTVTGNIITPSAAEKV